MSLLYIVLLLKCVFFLVHEILLKRMLLFNKKYLLLIVSYVYFKKLNLFDFFFPGARRKKEYKNFSDGFRLYLISLKKKICNSVSDWCWAFYYFMFPDVGISISFQCCKMNFILRRTIVFLFKISKCFLKYNRFFKEFALYPL